VEDKHNPDMAESFQALERKGRRAAPTANVDRDSEGPQGGLFAGDIIPIREFANWAKKNSKAKKIIANAQYNNYTHTQMIFK
jgi:hypothetical protein